MTDIAAAAQFIAAHARLIERRRFAVLEGDGSADNVLRALAPYRNDDGGIGHLEPDLRTPASQPACVIYALEILHEVEAADTSLATGALDWLQTVTLPDGGVPFALPTARGWPRAPWFEVIDDEPPSSLLMTAAVAAAAHRLGLDHPWLAAATDYCWERAGEIAHGHAYTLRNGVDFLDAVPDRARADAVLATVAERIPPNGLLRVEGGTEDEVLRPLDLARRPGHAGRRLYDDAVIERELDRLEAEQRDDGGWTVDFLAWNPVAAWEWRGIATVLALQTLRAYDRLR
jgi:hypothetical protein